MLKGSVMAACLGITLAFSPSPMASPFYHRPACISRAAAPAFCIFPPSSGSVLGLVSTSGVVSAASSRRGGLLSLKAVAEGKGVANVGVVLLAGGVGSRMKAGMPKQFMVLKGKPMLMHSLELFLSLDGIKSITIVIAPEYRDMFDDIVAKDSRIRSLTLSPFPVPRLLPLLLSPVTLSPGRREVSPLFYPLSSPLFPLPSPLFPLPYRINKTFRSFSSLSISLPLPHLPLHCPTLTLPSAPPKPALPRLARRGRTLSSMG